VFRNKDASVTAGWRGRSPGSGGLWAGEQPSRTGEASSVAAVQPALQLAVIEVKTGQVPVTVEVTGQVTAVYQATLASRIQGTIDESAGPRRQRRAQGADPDRARQS
jgi:multidrug efflux pump subunit AcrA (membrane-fusion protein)